MARDSRGRCGVRAAPRDSSFKDKARYETVQKEVESSLGHDRAEFLPLVRLVKRLQGREIRD